MKTTPKSLRLHIGLFGRTNVGKSSLLNMIAGQDVAITSPVPGTTTDVVEKVMELLPIGPVVFLDTGGLDDTSQLGSLRVKKTRKVFDSSDIVLLVAEPDRWTDFEDSIMDEARKRSQPVIVAVNKTDLTAPSRGFIGSLVQKGGRVLPVASTDRARRDDYVNAFKRELIDILPEEFVHPPSLIGDLIPRGGTVVLVVPIDLEAPKGRIILPQVQTIRDTLDNGAIAVVAREKEYVHCLAGLKHPPHLVVGDSQAVLKMVGDTPKDVKCTTFSIVFSRSRGDLAEAARGVTAVDRLKAGDRVLIAEACSHHAVEDDIGRVKIPRWLKQYTGLDIQFDVSAGSDFPEDLSRYALIIHCGGCMINRRLMLSRIQQARAAGVSITNYGVCISYLQGVLERVLSPFPAALDAYKKARTAHVLPCENKEK